MYSGGHGSTSYTGPLMSKALYYGLYLPPHFRDHYESLHSITADVSYIITKSLLSLVSYC